MRNSLAYIIEWGGVGGGRVREGAIFNKLCIFSIQNCMRKFFFYMLYVF